MMVRKFRLFILSVAPGLFLLGYNIGTGSVTSMASAGADYGMGLFWTLLLAGVFTYVMVIAITRITIVSGDTVLTGMRKAWGRPVALSGLILLVGSDIFGLMGVMGIIGEVIQEWSRQWLPASGGIPPLAAVLFFMVLLAWLFWVGRHSFFEKALIVMVSFMAGGFVISLFYTVPSPAEILKGLKPMVPPGAEGRMLVGGMVGTTLCAAVIAVRSILVSEAGWKTEHFKTASRDTLVAVFMMIFLSAVIMACAAGTLHLQGLHVSRAIDMVVTLEPLGRAATTVFVLGILGAGLSSVFPLMLLAPWMICDYLGRERRPKEVWFRVLGLLALAQAPLGPLLHMKPVAVMIATQALSSIAMPFLSFYILYAVNRKACMGEYRAGPLLNAGCVAAFLFSTVMAFYGVKGLIGNLSNLISHG